jgi:hypothetical protein
MISLAALSALLAFSVSRAGAGEQNPEHPFIEQKDIKSETCLACHVQDQPDVEVSAETSTVSLNLMPSRYEAHQDASEGGRA